MGPLWREFGLLDAFDIALVAVFAWLAIRFLRQTRARVALLGLGLLGAVYAVAQWIGLELTAALFRGFFAAVVLLIVVVFQQDLRRFFEQLGAMLSRSAHPTPLRDLDVLVRAVSRLASSRTGALIVLPGREPLDSHLDGGVLLGGQLSEPLLLSLFDTGSPGHDGAIVIVDGRVERFSTHLPLSSDHAQLGPGGTRHAAGLGLAERCDALCIVVSEERGTVSVARDGRLRTLSRPEDLLDELRAFRAPRTESEPRRFSWITWAEPAGAVAAALILWFVLIPGATQVTRVVEAPVIVDNLPSDLVLESVEPATVEVTLSGLRRSLLLLSAREVDVHVDAFLARLGRRTFELDESGVTRPEGVDVADLDPRRIRIAVRNHDDEVEAPPAEAPGI